MKVLVVDDDADLRSLLVYALRQAGLLALEAASGEAALEAVQREAPDLLILDLNLPGIDGFEVCRRMRAEGDRTPILMLTVRGEEESQVRGLDLGADDYLTKPFSPRTLLARVRALLRRTTGEARRSARAGGLELDEELEGVRIEGGAPVRLTALEFRLLQMLLANAGHVVAAERLLRHVWGPQGDRQQLKQLVHRLRQKIEDDPSAPRRLCTEPGLGYRLVAPEEQQALPPGTSGDA